MLMGNIEVKNIESRDMPFTVASIPGVFLDKYFLTRFNLLSITLSRFTSTGFQAAHLQETLIAMHVLSGPGMGYETASEIFPYLR